MVDETNSNQGLINELVSLRRQLSVLKKSEIECKQIGLALKDVTMKLTNTFDAIRDSICLLDEEGHILQCNQAHIKLIDKRPEDVIGKKCYEFIHGTHDYFDDCPFIRMKKSKRHEETEILYKDRCMQITVDPVFDEAGNILGAVHIMSDITERKKAEQELKIKTESIEELNTALKVILKQVEESKEELNSRIFFNIRELVLPSVDKLQKTPLSSYQLSLLQSIESNLTNISSSFLRQLKMNNYSLTPREIEIAGLVKEGKSIKQIAEQINISTKTVEFHRNSLREKLGLKNKKVNLRSHLLNIQ